MNPTEISTVKWESVRILVGDVFVIPDTRTGQMHRYVVVAATATSVQLRPLRWWFPLWIRRPWLRLRDWLRRCFA